MKRKLYGVGGVVVVALIASVVAWAYYGGSGTGTATASAGHAPRTVTVVGGTCSACPLFPGQSSSIPVTVSLTGSGNVRVGSVTATAIHTSNEPSCDPAWFSFTPPGAGQFPAGANVSSGTPLLVTGTLTFTESGTLQDACSDASVTIDLQASPS